MMDINSKRYVADGSAQFWCSNSRGSAYLFEDLLAKITAFHGCPAPGLVIGAKMVDVALCVLPKDTLFDAIAETGNCLPDAIQMLTPCTIGNGWLKVMALGRFALTLYDKYSGKGVRVSIEPLKIIVWPQIDTWFFKRRPKAEQDSRLLLDEIQQAGDTILGSEKVRVDEHFMMKTPVGPRGFCPRCAESYPLSHGDKCRACQGASPYTNAGIHSIEKRYVDIKGV